MVTEIPNIIHILNELSSNNKFKFAAKLAGNFIRISPETIRDKMPHFCQYFKQNNMQHYIVPDRGMQLYKTGC